MEPRELATVAPAPEITIVIPTVCAAERRDSLLRAVASVRSASSGVVEVLAVVNGSRVDEHTFEALTAAGVRTLRQAEGSLPRALATGRAAVCTPFFGFLDDDDELLPGALDRRLEPFKHRPELGLVVSNGHRELRGKLEPMMPGMAGIAAEPLRRLLVANWLASCGGLYRSSAAGVEHFEHLPKFSEWTYLAFQLCLAGIAVETVEALDYIVHDTPQSLSKSEAYQHAYVALFDRMLGFAQPAWARAALMRKRCAALHDLSDAALRHGRWREAARLHLASLRPPHGLRYLSYSRHVLAGALGLGPRSR